MNEKKLVRELQKHIKKELAIDLVSEFVAIRNDCKTGTLGRSSVGKFVETVVQVLQTFETGNYDQKPSVDSYLKNLESRSTVLNDDLKIVCSRIARASYSLRNKRSIAHKGSVDQNIYDLRFLYASAQWILSEIVRQTMKSDMATAGAIIEYIQIPASSVVEDFGERKIVFGDFTVRQEILVLLHSYYPEYISRAALGSSLDRRANSSISNSLNILWNEKLIHKEGTEFKLTQRGFSEADKILKEMS